MIAETNKIYGQYMVNYSKSTNLPGISADIFSLSEEIRLQDSGSHVQVEIVHSVSSLVRRNVRVVIVSCL